MAFDYQGLLRNIQNQKCALVLGPNACLSADGQTTFASQVADRIRATRRNITYYPNDDLYYIPSRSDRTIACNVIHDVAREAVQDLNHPGFYQPLYQQLTELPFHLVLSLSPDTFLFHWMQHQGLTPQFAYLSYAPSAPTAPLAPPTVQQPLIFNLFGETSKAESLVLTQEDVYNYLKAVFDIKKLEALRTALSSIDFLIFLGFPLDRWYVKLLMLVLEVNSNSRYVAYATHPKWDAARHQVPYNPNDPEVLQLADFCDKHYKIVFAQENFLDFIRTLHAEAVGQAGMPRPVVQLRTRALAPPVPEAAAKQTVAVSYAGDEQSVAVAAQVTKELIARGYEVQQEKITMGYRGNVDEFIRTLGAGRAVVVILSDLYLKDKKCMKTCLLMEEHQNLAGRIFPIVLGDADIYDVIKQLDYRDYWQQKIDRLNAALAATTDRSYLGSVTEELDLFSNIKRFIAGFMGIVTNMNVLTPDIHQSEDFASLLAAIEAQFAKDLQPANP